MVWNLLFLAQVAAMAAAAPKLHLNGTFAPWQVESLSTREHSYYPNSAPYNLVYAKITDPNYVVVADTRYGTADYDNSSVECTIMWRTGKEDPWTMPSQCTYTGGGKWSMQLVKPSASANGEPNWKPIETRDFILRITHIQAVNLNDGVVETVMEATPRFILGGASGNLAGSCGGSGVCGWSLKPELRPLLASSTLKSTVCDGDCTGLY